MHAIITIIIAGIPTRPGYYTARCDGLLFCSSGQPLFDGARELLASSCPADATLETRYAGSEVASVVSAVCATAKLTVSEESNRPQRFKVFFRLASGLDAGGVILGLVPNVQDRISWKCALTHGRRWCPKVPS